MALRQFIMFSFLFVLVTGACCPVWANGSSAQPGSQTYQLEEAERNFGFGFFSQKGYKDFIEPRVSFVKRHGESSEVIEYSWRPMEIYDMPHKERIDIIRCSFNKYF